MPQRRQHDDARRIAGYAASGKNVPLNRNNGRITSWIRSKSCHVRMNEVAAMPTAAKANPISRAPGSVSRIERRPREPEDDHHAQEADRVQRRRG